MQAQSALHVRKRARCLLVKLSNLHLCSSKNQGAPYPSGWRVGEMRSVDVSHWGLLCRFGQHDRHEAFPILSQSNLAEVCTAFTLLGLGQRVVIYKDLFQVCDFACGLVPCDFLSHRAFRTIMDISMFRSSNLSRCGKRLNTADSSFKFQRVEMFETVNLSGSSSHPWSKPRLVPIFRLLF